MKLTKRIVEELKLPTGKDDLIVWDDVLANFGVRLRQTKKTFICQYRTPDRRTRRFLIGDAAAITPESARAMARDLLVKVAHGQDPSGERKASRRAVNLKTFWTSEAEPFLRRRVRASSLAQYAISIVKHVIPKLGTVALASLGRRDIVRLHASMAETPYAANRMLSALRVVLAYAKDCGVVDVNVASGISKFKEHSREAVLSSEQLKTLMDAIDTAATETRFSPHALAAIKFLIWSGLRKREATFLRWDWVDEERHTIRFPQEATKTGGRVLALSQPAWEVVAAQNALGCCGPFVFPGRYDAPVEIDGAWRHIRKAAGMPKLRIHDLRHSYATWCALDNLSGPVIQNLLGHKDLATSQKYVHLAGEVDPMRIASQRVADTMLAAIDGAAKVREVGGVPDAGQNTTAQAVDA